MIAIYEKLECWSENAISTTEGGANKVLDTLFDFAEDGECFLDLTAEEGFSGSPVILNNSELKLIGIIIRGNPGASTTTYIPAYELLRIDIRKYLQHYLKILHLLIMIFM